MSMEKFGDLLLMERLAAGGMAEVFRGKQLGYAGFEKTVAIKRILPHFASSDEFKNMFRLEANLSAMLQHPNITQIFANGEHEGYLYLVMEFVDGKNLRQLLGKADKLKYRIPVEVACYVVGEAAKGLDYAHNFHDEKTGQPMNIVHRDVSPQNIMLGYEGSVKVVDFGIAKAAARAESTRAGVLKGKFGYMSPEQARGETLDKRSDIFALGIILWELLTQRRLFSSDDEMKTLQNVRECKVPRPSSKNPTLPYALEKIVMRALEKDPTNRYSSSGDLYGDLVRYMNDRHPSFIPTDFTKFMKEFYKEEISEERKRREKLNLEAPAFLAKNKSPSKKKRASSDEDSTNVSTEEDTLVSDVREENKPIAIEGPDIRESLNLDPSKTSSPNNNFRMPPPLVENSVKQKIQIATAPSAPPVPSTYTSQGLETIAVQNTKSKTMPVVTSATMRLENRGNKKNLFIRLTLGVLLLAMGGYGVKTYLDQQSTSAPNTPEGPLATNPPPKDPTPSQDSSSTITAPTEVTSTTSQGAENPVAPVETPNNDPSSTTLEAATSSKANSEPNRILASDQIFVLDSKPNANYGTVTLTGVPEAHVINIDGKRLVDDKRVPIQTPFRNLKFPPGKYQVELKNTVFNVSKTIELLVEKDKNAKIEVILNKR